MRIHLPARRCRLLAVLVSLSASGGLLAAADLDAQDSRVGHRVRVGVDRPAGAVTVTPRSGAPGTVIAVRGEKLPPGVAVQIMIGAIRSGFEVVAAAVSDDAGNLSGSSISAPGTFPVTIPEWVQRDRSYLLILTDRQYNPLAVADVFYPTDADGNVLRTGRVERDEGSCPTLTNDQDEVYFLEGGVQSLGVGDQVTIEGRMAMSESCGPGPTIQVGRVVPVAIR